MPSRRLACVALLLLAAAALPGVFAGDGGTYEGWAHQLHDCRNDWGSDSAAGPDATGHDLVALDLREGTIPGANGTGFGLRLTMEGGFQGEPDRNESLAEAVNLTIESDDGTQDARVLVGTGDDRDFVARSHTFPDHVGRTNLSDGRFHVEAWYNHHRFGLEDGDAVVAEGVAGYHVDEDRQVHARDHMPGGYTDPETGETVEDCPEPADPQRYRDEDGYEVRRTPGPPPVADFTHDEEEIDAGEEVRFTDRSTDSNDTVERREWYFEDGAEAAGPNVTHTFEEPGDHEVTLVVTDAEGNRNLTRRTLEVTPAGPVASTGVEPTHPHAGEPVYFNSTSGEADENLTYDWGFGDGATATGRNVSHRYAEAGTYEVTLTVTDSQGRSDTGSGNLTVGPRQNATEDGAGAGDGGGNATDEGDAGDEAGAGDGSRDPGSGDGSNATGENRPPTPRIEAPAEAPLGAPVPFASRSADPDGEVVARQWRFDDGGTHGRPHPNHTYRSPGAYNVTLTVVDDDGARERAHHEIVVGSPDAAGNESVGDGASAGSSPNGSAPGADGSASNGSAAQQGGGGEAAQRVPGVPVVGVVVAGGVAGLVRRRD